MRFVIIDGSIDVCWVMMILCVSWFLFDKFLVGVSVLVCVNLVW